METDDILAKAATPQSEVVVQISEDPLESVKIFVKTSCPKSVELCYDCSNTIKKLAMEGQQIDTKESKDDEAIKKYGVGKCEVEINNSDFERLIKLIERNYHKKHLDGDNSTENDIDSELDRQLRSTKNLLKEKSSKGRRTSNSSIVYETEYEDDEVDSDLKENCCISGTGPSQSPISVQNSKKPNLCSIIDKQTKNAGEGGSNTSDEWLSKETGDNSEEPNNSDIDSDSDKDTTFISKIPTLTPAQQQSDKEMRRLLRYSNIKILDSDDSDATVLKSDDGSDSDSDGKINCKTKSKRPIINSFDGEYCASNKESFSEDISNSNEPKKRMTAKKSHIDKNLTDSGGSKKKKRRIIYSDDDSDEKSSVADENNKVNDDEKLAKNIDRQKFASKRRLTQETREAEKAEKERRKRLEEKQREFNGIELIDDEDGNMSILYGQVTTTLKSITLDPDSDSNPPMPVCVHPSLVKILKKHQAEGIQFLYNCTIESVTRLEEPGGGAILGHCMGLGKTLQIIAFLHTILTHEKITKKINKVLVVVPKNVVLNWMNEFEKWLSPHLIVCDEGHKLKSPTTGLFHTINKVKTVRRICMTGTPLQNNLEEYYCMVNFVKPNLLGKLDEFKHRFSNIIKAGRAKDASDYDVRRMRRRCHVLFDRLKCVLDWRDYSVLRNSLPPKQEYVINIRLTKLQIDLYKNYLDCRNLNEDNPGGEVGLRLIYDHIILYRIWTHPYLLIEHVKREQNKCSQSLIDDFINADEYISESESDISDDIVIMNNMNVAGDGPSTSSNQNNVFEKKSLKRIRNNLKINDNPSPSLEDWAKSLISEEDRNNFEISNKLMLLIEIIKKCEKIGDKLLVFSQFLSSIALIERMLKYITQKTGWFVDGHRALMMADGEEWGWFKGIDYGVIDGSVSMISRDQIQKDFNDPLNLRNRLLLISTRAGSLGTNLIGANRVIIFDCSWNPSHDTQSLFRVYRFGQVKPVYIYRFVAQGTMEERIYNRQVTKESIAKRVTQAAQIQRHYTSQELEEMYIFEPDILSTDNIDGQGPRLNPPKDRLLGDIILEKTDAIVSYHPHDILFDELEDEKLTAEERAEAWKDYEREKAGISTDNIGMPFDARLGSFIPSNQLLQQQSSYHLAMQQQFQLAKAMELLFQLFRSDRIYNRSLKVNGMTHHMAMSIFKIKAFLSYFIHLVPENLAGKLNDSEGVKKYFVNIIDQAVQQKESPQVLYNKALLILRITIDLVRDVPNCSIGVRYISNLFPEVESIKTNITTF